MYSALGKKIDLNKDSNIKNERETMEREEILASVILYVASARRSQIGFSSVTLCASRLCTLCNFVQ